MDKHRISVVIPTHNRAAMVVEAVQSVLAQSYTNTELIVVDDGSVDDTQARLAAYGDRLVRLTQPNQGVSAARNAGIRRATGRYIAFLDSDDIWHPRKLELQTAYLREHPEISLLACRAAPLSEAAALSIEPADRTQIKCTKFSRDQLVIRASFATSGVLVKRSCLQAVGLFDTSLASAEDRDLWIRIASRFGAHRLEIVLFFDRPDQHEHLSARPLATEANTHLMIENIFRELPELRGRRLLKRRAQSAASYQAGILFAEQGNYSTALRRVVQSLALWPLPSGRMLDPRFKSLVAWPLRRAGLRRDFPDNVPSENLAT